MKHLIGKGRRIVVDFMERSGYKLIDVYETTDGYMVEYSRVAAGITTNKAYIYFVNGKVVSVETK